MNTRHPISRGRPLIKSKWRSVGTGRDTLCEYIFTVPEVQDFPVYFRQIKLFILGVFHFKKECAKIAKKRLRTASLLCYRQVGKGTMITNKMHPGTGTESGK